MNGLLASIPTLSREQAVEVQNAMSEDFEIDPLQMVESAARHLAHLARDRFLAGEARDKSVVVLAGTGGKGAVALGAARRLLHWGAKPEVLLSKRADAYTGVAAHELKICDRMKLTLRGPDRAPVGEDALVILDGMVGHGLQGKPRDALADGIRWTNAQTIPVLSLDVPSGMDPDSGKMVKPALKATATLGLGLPKRGLLVPGAEEFRGELYLGDIGIPEMAYRRAGIRVGPIFSEIDLLRLA